MYRIAVLFLSLAVVAPVSAGEKKVDAEAQAKVIAPYLDAQSFAVIHVDLTRVDAAALAAKVAELAKEDPRVVAKDFAGLNEGLTAFKQAGGKDVFVVFSLADLPELPVVVVPLHEGTDADALRRLREKLRLFPAGTAEVVGRAVVAGSKGAVARLRNLKAAPPADLVKALAAAGDHTVQILVLPSATTRVVVEQMIPTLPKELGGGPSTVLTRGIQWAGAGVDATPRAAFELIVQSQDAAAAQKLHEWIPAAFKSVQEQKGGKVSLEAIARLALLMPKLSGSRLTLALDEDQLKTALLPAMQGMRTSASNAQSANNLKQMALAMHNYHDTHKSFPAHASHDKNGRPLLSWRVHILPFVEQDQLYKQFHLDEPWDSVHNRKLISQMPAIYKSPLSRVGGEHKTVYLVPVGKQAVFTGGPKGIGIFDITDGTSNTIMIVEAADSRAVPWTKPEDLKVKEQEPLAGLVDAARTSFHVALADGSVRFLPNTIAPLTLWALFTRNGGEVVEFP